MGETHISREHKDRLFKFIFGRSENKGWTLSLYNAINGSTYSDPEEIEINTIEETVYMGMKNDVSYILRDIMSIYEQQSTFCPNMPVRQLMYAGRLYDKYIKQHSLNIYGRRQIRLPVPRLVVFYNGRDEWLDETELHLADAFEESVKELADISVRTRMVNINYGHSGKLMEACKVLSEYSWFVNEIRNNSKSMGVEMAVDKAIDDMPVDYELKTFLEGHRSEVVMSCLTEYDEEATMKMIVDDAREDGREEGRKEGRKEGREEGSDYRLINQVFKKINKGMTVDVIASELEESEETIGELVNIILTFQPDEYDTAKIYKMWRGIL